jgi:CubicO group peptidase (beta-lactamase class C family)
MWLDFLSVIRREHLCMNLLPCARHALTIAAALALSAAPAAAADPPMRCGPPAERPDGWPVATTEQRAFDPAVFCQTIARRWAGANLHGIVVEQHGVLQFEAYFDGRDNPGAALFSREVSFSADELHDLRSVTKSVTGLLIGIALDRGRLLGLDTPVLSYFPEHADLATPERQRITLAHLLTMTAGLAWDESGSYARLDNSETRMRLFAPDPERFVLEREIVAPPGTRYTYSGGATALLGEVIVRVTGQPLDVLAREWLFAPLGITHTAWRRDKRDRVTPYGGLRLRPRDLARIGRMLLDGGQWHGHQVVPTAWIDASFQAHVPTGNGELRYGYQWWRGAINVGSRRLDWVSAMGNGGQRLFLLPELDLVVVVTAGNYNQSDSWRAPMEVFRSVVGELGKKGETGVAKVRLAP